MFLGKHNVLSCEIVIMALPLINVADPEQIVGNVKFPAVDVIYWAAKYMVTEWPQI